MDRAIALHLPLTVMLLILFPSAGHWIPRHPLPPPPPISPQPLCVYQFSLVNRACVLLPYMLGPPPSPPTPPSPDEQSGGHHHHRHHHGHKHRHRDTPEEEDCCRWLKEVDNVCVCDLLVHLPPFLTIPVHNYTVIVSETCEVTFSCGSRLVRA